MQNSDSFQFHCKAYGLKDILILSETHTHKNREFHLSRKAIGPNTVTLVGWMLLLVFTSLKKTKDQVTSHISILLTARFPNALNKNCQTKIHRKLISKNPALIHFRNQDVTLAPSSPLSIYHNFIEMSNGLQRFKENKYSLY